MVSTESSSFRFRVRTNSSLLMVRPTLLASTEIEEWSELTSHKDTMNYDENNIMIHYVEERLRTGGGMGTTPSRRTSKASFPATMPSGSCLWPSPSSD
jgi:hypothetical protein